MTGCCIQSTAVIGERTVGRLGAAYKSLHEVVVSREYGSNDWVLHTSR
jgi:hypothetical protein